MKKILVVEDDKVLNKTLTYNLKSAGYMVDSVVTVADALDRCKQNEYELLVLDINLPDGSGFEVCRAAKERHVDTAIIFVTAKDMESDLIKGYEQGADDYVTKPFSIAVFQKKVAAILNRFEKKVIGNSFYDGYLMIDFSEMLVTVADQRVTLSPKEMKLLKILVKNAKQLLTRQILLERLWDIDGDFIDDHTLTTTLSSLRKKIETTEHQYIQTVYGMGYMWTSGEIL